MATTTPVLARQDPEIRNICAALFALADEKSEWGMDDPDLDQEDDGEMVKLMVDVGAFGPY